MALKINNILHPKVNRMDIIIYLRGLRFHLKLTYGQKTEFDAFPNI